MTFDKDKTQQHYLLLANYLGVDQPNQETLNYQRHFNAKSQIDDKPNVVIVILESFASYKSSLSGNPLQPSPNIKQLANEGYYLIIFYSDNGDSTLHLYHTDQYAGCRLAKYLQS